MRNGNSDVYLNRVTSGGTVDVATVVPPSRRLTFASANPSRGEIRMRLELPNAEMVSMEVIDATGRRVRSADMSALRDAGTHMLTWNEQTTQATRWRPVFTSCRCARGREAEPESREDSLSEPPGPARRSAGIACIFAAHSGPR
jgi:hypothetical protein